MILVTGASGKTGQAILRALAQLGKPTRAMIYQPEQGKIVTQCGAKEIISGDLRRAKDMRLALKGVEAVYLICPNMCPDEVEIGALALETAAECGVKHFVYHSVLHPQVEAMPHHWKKMRVEEQVFTSGLNFTILQPSAYMQNVLGYWKQISAYGIYALPYAPQSRLSLTDLDDVAEAAAKVLANPVHYGAIYELVGTSALSQADVASILSEKLKHSVQASFIDRTEWASRMRSAGMDEYSVDTLLKMFNYYENYGLCGCPQVLTSLLGRSPHSFADFIERVILEMP